MTIPNAFKNAISNYFYSSITTKGSSVVTDQYGNARLELDGSTGSIQGNFFEQLNDAIRRDLGVYKDYDGMISTNDTVQLESIFEYKGKLYKAVRVLRHDSHNVILLERWDEE